MTASRPEFQAAVCKCICPVRADRLCTQVDSLRFSGVPTDMAARIFAIIHYELAMLCGRQ
jgi:hypothetical protein